MTSLELLVNNIEKGSFREDLPSLEVGEKIEIVLARDFSSERNLLFKGIVIAKRNPNKLSYSFTVVREIGKLVVTTIFFYHLSPIKKIKKEGKIKVRRAKLYYLERKLIKKN